MASTPTPSPVTPTSSPPVAPATPPPVSPPAPVAPAPTTPPPVSPPPATTPPTAPSPPPPKSVTPPPPGSAPPPSTPESPPPSTPDTPPPPPVAPSPPGTPDTPSPPPPSKSPSNPSPSNPSPSTPKVSPSTPSPSSPSSGVSTSLVVGVAVGGLVILLLLSLFCVCCWRKKKRREQGAPPPMHYNGPPPPAGYQAGPYKADPYGGQYQQHWQQAPPQDHVVKISSDPLPPPPHASRPPQGPPTPPLINSGGSGSNYSAGGDPLPPPSPPMGTQYGVVKSTFTYEELVIATDGFADSNLLGQGGFGYVHKGVLPNGKEVAVKQLKIGSGQGDKEFNAEVDIISRVHHKHLVSLVGHCVSGEQKLLVYDFVPNNTLEFHLHGKGRPTMEWSTRMKIALGAAKGLAYLHEDCHPKIIHRDIKASNILVDYKFEAKVADFGLAKITSDTNTHVSTRIMGTFGYLAPEYAASGKLTDKSDVFSYGVMLLELITGKRPVDTTNSYMDDSLVDWARPLLLRALEEGNYDQLVDQRLGKNLNSNEMARMIACAAACVRHSAKRRPRMSQVVRALEGDVSLEDLNEGVKPGHSRFFGSYSSSDYDSSHYNEDMKKFRKMALQSNDYQSSQYSAPTSEYGLNPSGSSGEGQHTRDMEMGKMKVKDSSSQYGSGGY